MNSIKQLELFKKITELHISLTQKFTSKYLLSWKKKYSHMRHTMSAFGSHKIALARAGELVEEEDYVPF